MPIVTPQGTAAVAAQHRGALALQTAVIVLVWLVPAVLHASNDGLWFLGDAARHALNGLFWWDFISTLPHDPREYILRYYARYPAITPLSYPPVFYLLEGAAFRIFGASPFVAKWLVLCFSLVACLYLAAWLRRYVAFEAGWGAALLALQPGVVLWSNAVMLNVPAMALGVVGLYYARRWQEEPLTRYLLLVVTFGVLASLTYFLAALVAVAMCLWLVGGGRWRVLWTQHRTFVLLGLGVLLPGSLIVVRRVPLPFDLALSTLQELRNPDKWLFYIRALPRILNASILLLAATAFPAAVSQHRWRRDVRLLTIWIVTVYVGLSYFWSRDARYALLLAPAFVVLAMIGLRWILAVASSLVGARQSRCFRATLVGLVAVNGVVACVIPVPSIEGFREVATFVDREAPTERTLYDGDCDGVFTFYLRAQDPAFKRAVVRGSKLLYASAIMPTLRLTERVSSPSEVIEALKTECGCGWIAIERQGSKRDIAAARYLREAVTGPEFRLVRSFPIRAPAATQLNIYEFLGPLRIPEELELPFPILGEHTVFRARPIER